MATATPTAIRVETDERRFLIPGIDWHGYETLLEVFGNHGPRMSYSAGSVELMAPHVEHERFGNLFGQMIELMTLELGIPRNGLGSTTLKSRLAERGLEPDECYYIANAGRIGRQPVVNLDDDPPPDLAIEVEITSPLLDKLDIYAGLRVPEIWRYDGEILTVLLLQDDGKYARSESSRAFPFLPMADFARFLAEYDPTEELSWLIRFRDWVREVLHPLHRNPTEGA